MDTRIQSIKFDADQKLLDFVEKKVSKLSKFYEGITAIEVSLSLLPDHENKCVKMRACIPGNDIIIERNAKKFEDAVNGCVDVLKENLVKAKEKKHNEY